MTKRSFAARTFSALALSALAIAQTGSIPLRAKNWRVISSAPVKLSNDSAGDLLFSFPSIKNFIADTDQGSIHYLYMPYSHNLTGGNCNYGGTAVQGYCLTLQFQIVTAGAPTFNYELEPGQCLDYNPPSSCNPASVSLYLQRKGDDWQATSTTEWYRWWANVFVPLQQGVFEYTVPLTWDQWFDVYGRSDQSQFQATLANLANAGLTFGGGFYRGHGVNVSGGTAEMVITRLAVTQ